MSDSLFDGVLRLLLNQYGYAKVSRRLEAINRSGKLGDEPELSRDLGGAHPQIDYSSVVPSRRKRKIRAPAYVEKLSIPKEKKLILLQIARQFEDKVFLPKASNIRNFLEVRKENEILHGVKIENIKSRQSAIPRIFMLLSTLSGEELKRIYDNKNYFGPSRLGPLADAIRATGENFRILEDSERSTNLHVSRQRIQE